MTAKYTIEYIKTFLISLGWTPLFNEYLNNKQKLHCVCPNNHEVYIRFNDFEQAIKNNRTGCNKCGILYKASKLRNDFDEIKKRFEQDSCILISNTYKNNRSSLEYICPNGHNVVIKWVDFVSNDYTNRCPTCHNIELSLSSSDKAYCQVWSDKGYKTDIKNRDNNICQNPYCYKIDKRLTIHHIDYDKQNCSPSNLITLCGSCNSRANTNREWHKDWYQTIMKKKFNYIY